MGFFSPQWLYAPGILFCVFCAIYAYFLRLKSGLEGSIAQSYPQHEFVKRQTQATIALLHLDLRAEIPQAAADRPTDRTPAAVSTAGPNFSACYNPPQLSARGVTMRARDLGTLLLAIWLIATGVVAIVPALNFAGLGTALAIIAIAAGILILIRR
jgi:hypothetical protein